MIESMGRPHLSFDMGSFNQSALRVNLANNASNYPTPDFCHNFRHPFADFLLRMHMAQGSISKFRHLMWNRALASEQRSRARVDRLILAGEFESAGKEQLRLGRKIWNHSKLFSAGRWNEAERMYILGAMMMIKKAPPVMSLTPDAVAEASGLLLAKRILSENMRGSNLDERNFVFSDPIGLGSRVTVKKIYGRDEVLKQYDGGYVRFMSSPDRFFSAMHQIQVLEDSPALARRQAVGFSSLAAMGIFVPRVLEQGRDYIIADLVEGILMNRVSSILGKEDLVNAALALASYLSAIAISDAADKMDLNLGPNLIYGWDGAWRLIDF